MLCNEGTVLLVSCSPTAGKWVRRGDTDIQGLGHVFINPIYFNLMLGLFLWVPRITGPYYPFSKHFWYFSLMLTFLQNQGANTYIDKSVKMQRLK